MNVKLNGACAELKITYELYGLSKRNPIREVRIAEPLLLFGYTDANGDQVTSLATRRSSSLQNEHGNFIRAVNAPCW